MQVIQYVSSVIVLVGTLLFAVAAASVNQVLTVIVAAILLALIVPRRFSSSCTMIWATLWCLAIWRCVSAYIHRGLDYINFCDIFLLSCSTALLFCAYVRNRKFRIALWLVTLTTILICSLKSSLYFGPSSKPSNTVAYLERGKWGVTHVNTKTLDISSQYSYSIIKECLNARIIADLTNLDKYSCLWIITPTKPFEIAEIEKIRAWVYNGGHLVVVSDHTDLFGHAEVLNELLRSFSIQVGKDCVISDDFSDVPFYSIVGKLPGLTGNTIRGDCWPFLLHVGFRENVDYCGRSFFSDNAATDEDRWGVYCAGAFRACGRGMVYVFSDSTLLADFAISRPVAQIIVRMIRDGLFLVNLPFILFMFCSILLVSRMKRSICNYLSALLIICCVVHVIFIMKDWYSASSRSILSDGRGARTSGNWGLMDGDGHKYDVLFSAWYASGTMIPEWSVLPFCGGRICCNNIELADLSSDSALKIYDTIEKALTSSMSVTAQEFDDSLVANSYKDSIWFDAGAGIFKEHAYVHFWRSMYGQDCPSLQVTGSKIIKMAGIIEGSPPRDMLVQISDVKDHFEWVVVGDWMIGKRVGDEVLLRKQWQHPSRQFQDVVLTPIK